MDDASIQRLVSQWADGLDVTGPAKNGVRLLLSQLVPPTDVAAVLTIEEDDRAIAALHASALYLVQGAAAGEDDAPAAHLRVIPLRGPLTLSAIYREEGSEGSEGSEGVVPTLTWTLTVPDDAPLSFTTRRTLKAIPGEDERLARAVAEALGCP